MGPTGGTGIESITFCDNVAAVVISRRNHFHGIPGMVGGGEFFRYGIIAAGAGGDDGARRGTGRVHAGRNRVIVTEGRKDFRLSVIAAGTGRDDRAGSGAGGISTVSYVIMTQSGKGFGFCLVAAGASTGRENRARSGTSGRGTTGFRIRMA